MADKQTCFMSKKKLTDAEILSRRLVCDTGRKRTAKQHTTPCRDCPWSRLSLPGYLGGYPPEWWIAAAHGEDYIDCHCTSNQQCAGAAIYRANVCKHVRDPRNLSLPEDTDLVFKTPMEFLDHHHQQ